MTAIWYNMFQLNFCRSPLQQHSVNAFLYCHNLHWKIHWDLHWKYWKNHLNFPKKLVLSKKKHIFNNLGKYVVLRFGKFFGVKFSSINYIRYLRDDATAFLIVKSNPVSILHCTKWWYRKIAFDCLITNFNY